MMILDLKQPYEFSLNKADYISILSNSCEEKNQFAELIFKNLPENCGIVYQNTEKNFEYCENYENQKCGKFIAENLERLNQSVSEIELRTIESLSVTGLSEKSLTCIKDLSAAEKQLLAFAKMLSLFPQVMILENPFCSLSQNEKDNIFQIVDEWNKKGNTVIFSTDSFVECFRASRIIVLENNRIIFDGSRDEFLKQNDLLKNLNCCKN